MVNFKKNQRRSFDYGTGINRRKKSPRVLPVPAPGEKTEVVDFIEFLKKRSSSHKSEELKGLWRGFSIHITASEIKKLRQESWEHFPRDEKA
ncbi:hypothetical protein [Geoalkalibacter subterraneus]|uniref:DUF2281 domain-containing protein n=1 Tax=Geoalkalibacter subterraneus TaxID=483547 RepID=A0A0B5FR07_9BACT|nr:hypothetical protein [Geoalkalibacter subterraneus]AJF06520.1 hypothetical protein GSUB_08120 [Geoalkalibacter subterraneus]